MIDHRKTVLLITELGVGAGHLAPLCEIADELLVHGHDCHFIAPELITLKRLRPEYSRHPQISASEFTGWKPIIDPHRQPVRHYSLADILGAGELSRPDRISEKLGWLKEQLATKQPDLVVAEFAPGITGLVRGSISLVTIGSGYSLPPAISPLPLLAFWETELPPTTIDVERRLLHQINTVLQSLQSRTADCLADLFRGDHNFPCTFQCFDPYRDYRSEQLYAPLTLGTDEFSISAASELQRGFVYYSIQHPVFSQILSGLLSQQEFAVDIYSPAYQQQLSRILGSSSKPSLHRVLKKPISMQQLGQYKFCVHPGGLGICSAAAVRRVPQLLSPISLESLINAYALHEQKAAVMLMPEQLARASTGADMVAKIKRTIELPMSLSKEFELSNQLEFGKQADGVAQRRPTVKLIVETIRQQLL